MSTARIPPAHEELEFVRNKSTGRVHVKPYVDPDSLELVDVPFGEALLRAICSPRPMLCGAQLVVGHWPGATADYTGAFPDDDLCIRCVKALGDQSARAFEGHYPEEEE